MHMRYTSNVAVLPWSYFHDLSFSSDLFASLYGQRVKVVQHKLTQLFVLWLDTGTPILASKS